MKKLAIFAAAFVLTLGLAQCKKEQPATPQNTEGNKVHITVNVGNGSRAGITTPSSSGEYNFNNGDLLYVGYDNACVGTLAYNSETSKFSGNLDLTEAVEAQKLHFYYLGGGAATQVGETQQYTVDISNQTSNYPVISYGTSTQNYSASLNSYTTTLLNQCALVEFTTNEIPTTTAVSISGMKNKVTVDFNGNTLTPSEERGTITLHNTESTTERWAILLPDDNEVTTTATAEDYFESESFNVPAVAINDYLHGDDAVNFTMTEIIVYLATVTSNRIVKNGQILTGTLGSNVKISIAAGATVTLDDVTINGENEENYSWAGITCNGDATIILKDGSENTVKGFYMHYPGIYVPGGSTLTIDGGSEGTGSLTASSNGKGAGIGGGERISCGSILIEGGTVTANGGQMAAGIGGGYDASCGSITISGGTVTANGGYMVAGIGGGCYGSCGAITITDGVTSVTATKGEDAPYSIGCNDFYGCGTVTIGGTVYWDGSSYQNGGASYLAQGRIIYPSQGPAPSVPTIVTWNNTNVFNESNVNIKVASWNPFAVFADIGIGLIGNSSSFTPYVESQPNSSLMVYGNNGDYFTFTAPSGKKFTKIEIIDNGSINFTAYGAWTQPANNKIEWNDTAANEVTLGGSERIFCYDLNSIVFTLVDE